MKFLLAVLVLLLPLSTTAEEIVKIQVGSSYQAYTHEDLQMRVWSLERAVWQLQQRVFQLEASKPAPQTMADTWICAGENLYRNRWI